MNFKLNQTHYAFTKPVFLLDVYSFLKFLKNNSTVQSNFGHLNFIFPLRYKGHCLNSNLFLVQKKTKFDKERALGTAELITLNCCNLFHFMYGFSFSEF